MRLREVLTSNDIGDFHRLARKIYQDDHQWVPYIKQDIEKLFDPKKNKLFKEGGQAIRWILEDDNRNLIGRIAAFINPRTLTTGKMRVGGCGFFECINDKKAAHLLFESCKGWLSDRGVEAMDGPINFGDRNQFWGLQVSNFDEPAIYPMYSAKSYYQELFESYGFQTYFNQYVFWRDLQTPAQEVFIRKYRLLGNDPGFRIETIKGKKKEAVARDFMDVYNNAWGGHSHFKPLTYEISFKIINSMWPAMDPQIVYFVYYHDQPIAFYISLPELNQIFRHVNGNMNLWGKLIFMYHKMRRTATRMTGIIFGVVKEWQGKGIEAAMIVYAEPILTKQTRYKDTVLSWIGDFNPKMIKVAENLGATVWRTLITYRFQFDRNLPFERAPIVEEQRR